MSSQGYQRYHKAAPVGSIPEHAPYAPNPSHRQPSSPQYSNEPTCPVSNARRSSGAQCPVAHGASHAPTPSGSTSKPAAPHPDVLAKDAARLAINDDVIEPVGLPDVSDDLNPVYEEFDDELLYVDLRERVRYLLRFSNFTERDVEALNDFQAILLPMVEDLTENVYHHLFKFDVTKALFMPRKDGQEGRMLADLHDLTLDAKQITMRKKTFEVYLRKLVTSDYDDFATWQYFDHIGLMHTGENELKHRKLLGKMPLFVDLMHLSMLLSFTIDILTPVILTYVEYPLTRRIEILRAFQKVIWIQNDLFARHYAVRSTEIAGLNKIRAQHNLSSRDDVDALTGSDLLPTSTVSSSFSGGSQSSNSFEFPKEKQHKKHGLGIGAGVGWLRFRAL